jgi:hypothetical protein
VKAGKYIEAFQNTIIRVRGHKQSDIDKAKDNLATFIHFDPSQEINIGVASMMRVISELQFALGTELIEDERQRKFHQCVFNDERLPMHACVIDSIAKSETFQESVDQLFLVMEKLPIVSLCHCSRPPESPDA